MRGFLLGGRRALLAGVVFEAFFHGGNVLPPSKLPQSLRALHRLVRLQHSILSNAAHAQRLRSDRRQQRLAHAAAGIPVMVRLALFRMTRLPAAVIDVLATPPFARKTKQGGKPFRSGFERLAALPRHVFELGE
jgi:hypothetical protein